MKKFATVLILIFVLAFGVVAMSACDNNAEQKVTIEDKEGYLIQASVVDAAHSTIPIDVAELTVKCGKDIVDISHHMEYYDTIFGAYFVTEFKYYVIKVDDVIYGIEYVTAFADNILYFSGYSVLTNSDKQFARIYGTIWTELNDYSSIENMPHILEYFFYAPAPEIDKSGFAYKVDYVTEKVDFTKCSSMVYNVLDLWDNCIAEVTVSHIGSTFVTTATMPKAVQNFKNMVGEMVSTEGPAYQ